MQPGASVRCLCTCTCRAAASYMQPGASVRYLCEVLDCCDALVFSVTAEDDTACSHSGGCWVRVFVD